MAEAEVTFQIKMTALLCLADDISKLATDGCGSGVTILCVSFQEIQLQLIQ